MSVFRRGNITFLFFLMFLLTFTLLVITERTLITRQRDSQLQIYDVGYSMQIPEVDNKNLIRLNTSLNATSIMNGDWQTVYGTRYKFFVYSAYLDQRAKNQPVIRIIGTTKTKKYDRVTCLFHFENSYEFVPAKIVVMNENWNLKYSAVFVICCLKNTTHIPPHVSIVTYDYSKKLNLPSNKLTVLNRDQNENTEVDECIGICIKPIHFEYDKLFEIVEFIEVNRLLGIGHFTMYNSSMSSRTSCILNHYIEEGIVSLHPWQLSIKSQTEIRTENIFASLNDCLYRNMYSHSYVAFADLDEYVVPQSNFTIPQMLRWLDKRYDTSKISAYSFQNAFFYQQWEDDSQMNFANSIEKHLITLRKTRRRVKLHPHKQRSKYIVKPKNVVEVGNHFVWQFLPRQNTLNVFPDIAILNHYRVCEYGGDDCVRMQSVVDHTLYRYRKLLTCNFAQKWHFLSTTCSLPKITMDVLNDGYCQS